MTWSILTGDCIEQMRTIDDSSIDAVVCDPPYGIGFMGHEWDQPGDHGPVGPGRGEVQGGKKRVSQPNTTVSFGGPPHPAMEVGRYDLSLTANQRFQAWCELWATECLRVLKPGGHLLASCGSRTYQRMACGIEDAGFEIRDSIMWLYGSGFPKSHNVAGAIDKLDGLGNRGHRIATASRTHPDGTVEPNGDNLSAYEGKSERSRPWEGFGTALKPAHEPIVVARKPLIGTVAANVLEHGTGGINVDGCRLEAHDDQLAEKYASVADAGPRDNSIYGRDRRDRRDRRTEPHDAGRWPANVVLDEEAAAELDAQTGELANCGGPKRTTHDAGMFGIGQPGATYRDSGGASRFFYCAKTSRAERNAGLNGFASKGLNWSSGEESPGTFQSDGTERSSANHHPTVKPINLMRWLVRLVTPLGGTLLDPFAGSGSTGCAAVLEGFDFIGCEREPEYVAIAEARIGFWAQHVGREVEDVLGVVAVSEKARRRHDEMGQGSIFDDSGLELDLA